MGWRDREIWFDVDVLWFREHAAEPAAAFAANAPSFFQLPTDALDEPIPDGLSASRRRRAHLRRRRDVRRTRTAALVVGPAMIVALAAPKLGSASRSGEPLAEDPPSATFRSNEPQADAGRRAAQRPLRKPAAAYPHVRWDVATSHGLPSAGYLTGGTQLPVEGPDWVTWDPVTDSVPNLPHRLFGNEHVIRSLLDAIARYRTAHPDAPRVVVGDISFRGGGPMDEHRSHQNGLDVDVYYPRKDGRLRAPTTTDQIDRRLAQDLLDRFLRLNVEMVFVGYHAGLRGPGGVVVPYPSHENHMHVRFLPPAG
jgi:hypothetical protein